MKNRVLAAIVVVGAMLATSAMATPPAYDIVDLGLVSPTDFATQGMGVSPGGVAVGRSVASSGNVAFSWTVGGGLMPLNSLPSRAYHVANGANDSGFAVGTGAATFFGSDPLPVLWTNGVASQLALPAGQTLGRANDINTAGTVVGSVNGGSAEYGVIWRSGTPSPIAVTTPGGAFMRTAFRVNDAGMAVGFGVDPNEAARNVGLMYDSINDTMVEIPALPGQNGTLAFDISESGYVVGSSSMNQASSKPFVWDATNGSTEIPLPIGTSEGSARGVNSDGWVVGQGSGVYSVPFLYDGSETYRLQDLIDPASDWDLSTNTSASALGISDSGMIVGTGEINGNVRAYAMIPVPEPGTLGLLLGGLIFTARRRR